MFILSGLFIGNQIANDVTSFQVDDFWKMIL